MKSTGIPITLDGTLRPSPPGTVCTLNAAWVNSCPMTLCNSYARRLRELNVAQSLAGIIGKWMVLEIIA
ncbi:hypothetical protein RHS01_05405 [Rhizoctonia solani]|uniref:Uncharacterized protein n=1 Tax=Rhizoctonia solani TaxID=456999 RepID=A0A8H7IB01_9AGAM|nr:hypothetical protein RHS01_05405 [Rhizoctonia solani]